MTEHETLHHVYIRTGLEYPISIKSMQPQHTVEYAFDWIDTVAPMYLVQLLNTLTEIEPYL